jgi:hypothetical protein
MIDAQSTKMIVFKRLIISGILRRDNDIKIKE